MPHSQAINVKDTTPLSTPKVKRFLFLDIDGVLNSHVGHELLDEVFQQEDYQNLMDHLPYLENDLKAVRFLRHSKPRTYNNRTVDFGNFVETRLADRLAHIIQQYQVTVIGISSWFVRANEEDVKLISDCLGFPIELALKGAGGSGENRLNAVVSFLEEWRAQNENQSSICVYLDDDNYFNLSHQSNTNIINFTSFNNEFNGLFVTPHGRYGISDNQFKQIEHWFKLFD